MEETRYTTEPIEYYGLCEVTNDGDVRIITKESVPKHTAKCIVMKKEDGSDTILVIGWNFNKGEYFHDDIRGYFDREIPGYKIKGGGRISYDEETDTHIIYEKSVDYGEMEKKTVASFCKIVGNCYWDRPYYM